MKFVATDKNKNETKFKFQGQSARSQRWCDLDLDWIKVNGSTREPNLFKKLFQIHDDTQDNNTFENFQVTIGNAKCVESFKFQIEENKQATKSNTITQKRPDNKRKR